MSRNENQGRNAQQRELVDRLEQIRQKQNEPAETTEQSNEAKRNEGAGRPAPSRQKRQNRRGQRQKNRRSQPEKRQQQKSTTRTEKQSAPQRSRQEEILREQRQDRIDNKISQMSSRKPSRKKYPKKKSFVKKLANGQSLADAIVLSEVLSKPVALRKKNR